MTNIIAAFRSFPCPNCDIVSERTNIMEKILIEGKERVRNVHTGYVYPIQEVISGRLDCFGVKNTKEQKVFKKLTKFDFKSICFHKVTFKDTNKRT